MSFFGRVREIVGAIRGMRFPPPPKRRHDVIGEAMDRRFAKSSGRGPVHAAGVADDEEVAPERR